jgi:AraC-like DNA-binding protein
MGVPVLPPFPLSAAPPPYAQWVPVRRGETPPPGAVLALTLTDAERDREALRAWVPRLRAAHPDRAVVLRLAAGTAGELARLAPLAVRLGARAVVLDGEPPVEALRSALCEPLDLGDDVLEWLALRGTPLSPALGHLVGCIFRCAAREPELGPLLRRCGEADRTARARFRRRGLPAPNAWHQAARALAAALRLQRDPGLPLLRAAFELGYTDHSALSHQLRRAFGVRASEARATLGWEWLMDRWARRALREAVVTVAA